MILPAQIEKVLDLHNLAREGAAKFRKKRFIYGEIKGLAGSRPFVGIAGLRGVGKTVLLRQLALEVPDSVYISMDTLQPGIGLFELARELAANYGVKCLLLDEIHGYPDWQRELKKIFDFLDLRIVFTSSAAIDINQSRYDLSRRVLVLSMPPFSFREYLYFKKDLLIDKIGLDDVLAGHKQLYAKLYAYEPYFTEFCLHGTLPAAMEHPFPQVMRNIIEKIVNYDLLTFGKLDRSDILNVNGILRFISRSPVDVCSYSLIARNTGVSKYKATEYVHLLEQTFLLRVILPYGPNVVKEPKILYSLPFRAYFAEGVETEKLVGAMREEFFVQHITQTDAKINYLKSVRGEKLPDYIMFHKGGKTVFEIGGAGKKRAQLRGVLEEKKFVLSQPGNAREGIPLLLFGFLY